MALDVTIGGASSDSYITLAEWWAYWLARGVDLTQHGHDSSHEANLVQAADWIDRNYSFVGMQQYQTQRRAWPRLVDDLVRDWPIDPDSVPQDIKDAQAELAYLIHEGLTPWATIEGGVKSERVKAGPVESETEYAGTPVPPRLVAIEGLLRPYLDGSGGVGNVRVARG